MQFYSPLRYPGGKRKLAKYVELLLKRNKLFDINYIEPYAGGASVGLFLLFNEYASKVVINDLDRSIYAFWYSVLNRTEELVKLITDTKVDVANWENQRKIQKRKNSNSLLKLGFSTFYLNRTNRSGIISAGVIGGRKQKSRWKIDARFTKQELINRIYKIARFSDRIELFNLDACDLINNLNESLNSKTFIYFDPPYYAKGKDLYVNFYNDEDHLKVSDLIHSLKSARWIVSYDDQRYIKKLYKSFKCINYSLNYSTTTPITGTELMFFCNNLKVPRVLNPAKMQ